MLSTRWLGFTLLVALLVTPAVAHDMWIQPSTFHPAVGEKVEASLRLGHAGPEAEHIARNERRIVRFAAFGAHGETAILGRDGHLPAGLLRTERPGAMVLVYESNAAFSELAGEAFEAYLAEEGLEKISALRSSRGESGAPGRERYSRHLKSLLRTGPSAEDGDRPLGLRLELVAEGDPASWEPKEALPVRVLFEGRPLAGAQVRARPLDGREQTLILRSDDAGRVLLYLPTAGAWLLTVVEMVQAPEGSDADWESFWASLTFFLEGA